MGVPSHVVLVSLLRLSPLLNLISLSVFSYYFLIFHKNTQARIRTHCGRRTQSWQPRGSLRIRHSSLDRALPTEIRYSLRHKFVPGIIRRLGVTCGVSRERPAWLKVPLQSDTGEANRERQERFRNTEQVKKSGTANFYTCDENFVSCLRNLTRHCSQQSPLQKPKAAVTHLIYHTTTTKKTACRNCLRRVSSSLCVGHVELEIHKKKPVCKHVGVIYMYGANMLWTFLTLRRVHK